MDYKISISLCKLFFSLYTSLVAQEKTVIPVRIPESSVVQGRHGRVKVMPKTGHLLIIKLPSMAWIPSSMPVWRTTTIFWFKIRIAESSLTPLIDLGLCCYLLVRKRWFFRPFFCMFNGDAANITVGVEIKEGVFIKV